MINYFEIVGVMLAIVSSFLITSIVGRVRYWGFVMGLLGSVCLMVVYVGVGMYFLFSMSGMYVVSNIVGMYRNSRGNSD